MITSKRFWRSGCLAALALSATASATPLAVGDFSFEINSLGAGNFSNNIAPEWTGLNGSAGPGAFEEYLSTRFAAEGTDHLGMEENYEVWQDLAATYQPNTRYTLTIAAGNRGSITGPGNQSIYRLGDSTGAVHGTGSFEAHALVAPNAFADAPPVIFDTSSDPAAVGKIIRILLRAGGSGRSHFDNIRLDATALAPSGTASAVCSPATSVTANSATLHGRVTAIGNSAPSVTFFWGAKDGGIIPAAWENSVRLPGTWTGPFSADIAGLTENTNYHFTVRTTNSAGDSWANPSSNFETPPSPPVVATGTATGIDGSSATLAANVTETGGESPAVTIYYGRINGGTTPGSWASSIPLGTISGPGTVIVKGLSPSTSYFFRAYAENTGGGSWAVGTGSFSTLTAVSPTVVNEAPTGVTGTTATLRGEVIDTGNSPPAITIFYGTTDGGIAPGSWQLSAAIGTQSGNFTRFVGGLSTNTRYYFRCRAENGGGISWAPQSDSFTTRALVSSTPVINEVHYHPADHGTLGPLPLEFIELTNPGDTNVDLSGWKLADAVTYSFPAGTSLPPGGYLIVAQDPPTLLTHFGKSALGPWLGKLSNSGETIELRDAGNALQDTVSYQAGFPWPTSADGEGPSIELLNPALDNDLGGSWRSSGGVGTPAVTYVSPSASGWKYAKGTGEASSPVAAWRNPGFNDSSWFTGTTPIGYGNTVACNTVLTDMRGTGVSNYSTVFARKSFTLPVGQIPNALTLRVRFDDGCIVWINGTQVFRDNMPGGEVPFNSVATASIGTASFTTVDLTNASAYLLGGTNVIAIQGANVSKGNSSDFNIDAELGSPAVGISPNPTPGAINASKRPSNQVPPQARQITHWPSQPASGQTVSVTARITDPDGVGVVTLAYQVVNPGNYIRLTDAAYASSWTSIPMADNGSNGDVVAGDSVFTAVIPASVQTHRRLVRYRIVFGDSLGNSQTIPYADDEQPNFAYFVYNGLPDWTGALRPTPYAGFPPTPAATYPVASLTRIPTYHLIANATDIENCQYVPSFNGVRFSGTFVYDGEVYDHIQFKNRGIGSTYQSGKNKWNIFFNKARDLHARDHWGNPYKETWNNLLLNANSSPWAPINRGSAGIEEATSARIFELAGNTNFRTHYAQWRVIDDVVESSPSSQYDGDLWGLYLAIEPTEGNFLDERNLADGNVYAIEGNNGDKKHQGTGQPVDSADWNAFRTALSAGGQTEAWYRANMDLDKLFTFLAINRLIGNVDVRPGDNYRYFHRSSDNRWEILAYDLDMMYIAAHHWGGNMDGVVVAGQPNSIVAIMRHPALAREYRNRCRELLDLLASDGTAAGGQIGQLFSEYAEVVHPNGQTLTWANLDAALWNLHPNTRGSGGNSGQGDHKGNFYRSTFFDSRGAGGVLSTGSWTRTLADPDGDGFSDFTSRVKWFVDFATDTYPAGAAPWIRKASFAGGSGSDPDINRQKGYGYKYLEWESLNGGWTDSKNDPTAPPQTDFPSRPSLVAIGDPTFPVSDLRFATSAFADPQGPSTFAAWQWRIAEISELGKYEIQSVATSAELTAAPGAFTIPLGTATVGKTYRVRTRQKDTTGNWSHWSAPVQFAPTATVATLIHYWNFNTPATFLSPSQTIGGGNIIPAVTGASEVISHSSQDQGFSAENARNSDPVGSHLRANLPLGASLNLALPTTGYADVIVRYETRRSGTGAGLQNISYTLDGANYLPFATLTIHDADAVVQNLDFRTIQAANNNPNFGLRITFAQGAGSTGGNNRFDNLTVEANPLPGPPVLIPGGDASWNLAANWSSGSIPDATAAGAVINAPAGADRTVTLASSITIGTVKINNAATPYLNKIASATGVALTFHGGTYPALLDVAGTGTGHSELEIKGGTTLATSLRIFTSNIEGSLSYGALRLRESWTGPGGIIKQGPGLVALTGSGKNFTGPLTIEQGVIQLTQPAVPGLTSGVTVQAGGQLRLVSGNDANGSRVHTFGGILTLAGNGRGNAVPTGAHYGMLGALRFDPESGGTNGAIVTNAVTISADADIHTDGPDNSLSLTGSISGPGAITKSGGGALLLAGNSPSYTGPIVIANGTVEANGNLAGAAIQIAEPNVLRGSGTVGGISGNGTVAPLGTALTAPSTSAADYDFAFTQKGLAGNSVLRLTGANPFPSSPETVDLFVNPTGHAPGDRLLGGFFTAASYDLVGALAPTQVRLLVADPAGPLTHSGSNYRIAIPGDQLTWSVVTRSVDFGAGAVGGKTLEILVGGNPSAFAQWRSLWFPTDFTNDSISGPQANPTGDGIANLMRYALGVGPLEPASALLPTLVKNGTAREFRFRYDASKTDLVWRVKSTATLGAPWTHVLFDSQSSPIPPLNNGWLSVTLPATAPRQFVRLEVTLRDPG